MDSGAFNVTAGLNGSLYGIVLLHGSEEPSAVQIRNMLNATNFFIPVTSYFNVTFIYPTTPNPNDVNYTISHIANFTGLLDNTLYDAYFIAENNYPLYPDLLDNSYISKVTFLTQTELYGIPADYDFATTTQTSLLLIIITMFLVIINWWPDSGIQDLDFIWFIYIA